MILVDSPRQKALVPVSDRGFLYGDGAFATMRVSAGKLRDADAHMELLFEGLKELGIDSPHSPAQILRKLRSVAKECAVTEGVARVIVTRGESGFGLWGGAPSRPQVIVWMRPVQIASQEKGLKVTVSPWQLALPPGHWVKSMNYLSHVMAKKNAVERGFDEAILCGPDGEVLCGTSSNFFIVRRGKLLTPPAGRGGVRPGVTRAQVMQMARAQGWGVAEKRLTLKDCIEADELFFTSSVSGIRWAARLTHAGKTKVFRRHLSRILGEAGRQ